MTKTAIKKLACGFLVGWIALGSALASPSELSTGSYLSSREADVVRELNRARTDPAGYAALLQSLRSFYRGNLITRPGEIAIITHEGVRALDEAIRFLRQASPVPALGTAKGLSLGVRDHVRDQAVSGAIGHQGRDGSRCWERVNRYGKWQRSVGENIMYGQSTARDVVISLIIDDGVRDRGHRTNIFNPAFSVVGVAFGSHRNYGAMCAMAFAGGYVERH